MEPTTERTTRMTTSPDTYRERRQVLVDALRSGRYTQTRGALERVLPDNVVGIPAGHCCLGVGCREAEAAGLPIEVTIGQYVKYMRFDGASEVLPDSVQKFYGFRTKSGAYLQLLQSGSRYSRSLANDNDDRRHTFEQIADTIELGMTDTDMHLFHRATV